MQRRLPEKGTFRKSDAEEVVKQVTSQKSDAHEVARKGIYQQSDAEEVENEMVWNFAITISISCTEYSESKLPRLEYKPNVRSIQCVG